MRSGLLYGALAATLLLLPSSSSGQAGMNGTPSTLLQTQAEPSAPGTRVRLTPRSGPRVTGILKSSTPESLYLAASSGSETRGIAWSSLKSAEWSAASRGGPGLWVAAGLAAGFISGLVAIHGGRSEYGVSGFFNDQEDFAKVAASSLGGLVVGGLLGWVAHSDHWKPLQRPPVHEPVALEPVAPGEAERAAADVRQEAP